MGSHNDSRESILNEPQIHVSGDQPGSRPGLKTLVVTLVVILLFIGIKFSDSLMGLLTHGR